MWFPHDLNKGINGILNGDDSFRVKKEKQLMENKFNWLLNGCIKTKMMVLTLYILPFSFLDSELLFFFLSPSHTLICFSQSQILAHLQPKLAGS